jgi:hypothetical protein
MARTAGPETFPPPDDGHAGSFTRPRDTILVEPSEPHPKLEPSVRGIGWPLGAMALALAVSLALALAAWLAG